jgi:hypothetical protein
MKIRTILMAVVAVGGLAPSGGAHADQDFSARLEAVKRVKVSIKTYLNKVGGPPGISPYRPKDDDINLLIRGLADSEETVRAESLAGLWMITMTSHPANRQPRPDAPDLTHFAGAKEALLRTLSDSNPEHRIAAANIYAATFPVTPDLENQWIAAFREEQSDLRKQDLLTALLRSEARSPTAVAFVIEQMTNPKLAYDTAVALLAHVKPPPPEALPIMVAQFARSASAGKRSLLARSIELFGDDAKAYLPVLQEMLAQEKDDVVKRNLVRAITKLKPN